MWGVPARNEPFRNELEFPFILGEIDKLGYRGDIGRDIGPLWTTPSP
jgi:hydroxypyruvate isomerase